MPERRVEEGEEEGGRRGVTGEGEGSKGGEGTAGAGGS